MNPNPLTQLRVINVNVDQYTLDALDNAQYVYNVRGRSAALRTIVREWIRHLLPETFRPFPQIQSPLTPQPVPTNPEENPCIHTSSTPPGPTPETS